MPYDIEFLSAETEAEAIGLGFSFDSSLPLTIDISLYESWRVDAYRLEFGEWWYYYRKDGTLYLRHPSKIVIGRLVYTFTYVFDLDAFPVLREDGKTTDRVINERWLNGIFGNRKASLNRLDLAQRPHVVSWYANGLTCYAKSLGEARDMMLDPDRQKKHKNYRWLKDRRHMTESPKIVPWKSEGYIILWDIADKLRVDRSEMAGTFKRFRDAADCPFVVDDYYQPLVPKDRELDFIRWVKAEGFKNWNWDIYDLSEEEAKDVAKTRDEQIRDAVLTYPISAPKLKRTGWPWLVPLRAHAGMPDITSRERAEVCRGLQGD